VGCNQRIDSDAALGEVVTIAIGPEKKEFKIHEDLICHHSEYFRTAYNGRWKEADEGVALAEVEVDAFKLFAHWLYAQQLPNDTVGICRLVGMSKELTYIANARFLLLKACVFGDRFLARDFKILAHNTYVDIITIKTYLYSIPYRQVIYAFANLKDDEPILKFMVDSQTYKWEKDWDDEEEKALLTQLPHEFLVRVMHGFAERRALKDAEEDDGQSPEGLEACTYHIHASEEERKECRLVNGVPTTEGGW
jgi:hypothetical protein